MLKRKAALGLAKTLLVLAAASAAAEVKLPDGNDWAKSTERERLAYIWGFSNALTAGYVHDEKHLPGNKDTFTHRAAAGLSGTTVEQAEDIVDAWYKANPNQLNTPVLKVLWDQIGKPRLDKSKQSATASEMIK
jgi:hypothetical protein